MPDGGDGGDDDDGARGGKPLSRATLSCSAWFSTRSALIVACCASTPACRAALLECSRRASPTRRPTTSRNSASEKASNNAASSNDMPAVNHVSTLSATASPGKLPRLRSGVVLGSSRKQAGDQGAEQVFAASARVVHELEGAELERQNVLRDASALA